MTEPPRQPDERPASDPRSTPPPPTGPPAGGESYPLEASGEHAPLGADPPAPWPPCPSCGAPRRLPEPVCLQCGLDERPPEARSEPVAQPAHATAAASDAGSSASPPPPLGVPAAEPSRDPTLEPLLRRWPGGSQLTWIVAFALLLVLLIGGAVSVSGFPPAVVGEDGRVSLAQQIALTARLLAAAGLWSLAAWGVCLGLAWGQDREVGGRVELGGRMLLAAAASRLAILLPVPDPLLAFLLEGLLALLVLALLMRASLRVTWLVAAGLAAMTAFTIGATAMVSHVLAWILA